MDKVTLIANLFSLAFLTAASISCYTLVQGKGYRWFVYGAICFFFSIMCEVGGIREMLNYLAWQYNQTRATLPYVEGSTFKTMDLVTSDATRLFWRDIAFYAEAGLEVLAFFFLYIGAERYRLQEARLKTDFCKEDQNLHQIFDSMKGKLSKSVRFVG